MLCSFIDKIYIFRGNNKGSLLDSSLQVHPNCTGNQKWKQVAGMIQARDNAACAVFEGKIVVSGGYDNNDNDLNIVETYDVIGNEWSPMPNMVYGASDHSLAGVKSKLFVIGNTTKNCQIYDSICKKFVALLSQRSNSFFDFGKFNEVVKVGSTLFVFSRNPSSIVYCYDVERSQWILSSSEFTDNLITKLVAKIPSF